MGREILAELDAVGGAFNNTRGEAALAVQFTTSIDVLEFADTGRAEPGPHLFDRGERDLSFAAVGDIDRDGYEDAFVASPTSPIAILVFGSAVGASPRTQTVSLATGTSMGAAVASRHAPVREETTRDAWCPPSAEPSTRWTPRSRQDLHVQLNAEGVALDTPRPRRCPVFVGDAGRGGCTVRAAHAFEHHSRALDRRG